MPSTNSVTVPLTRSLLGLPSKAILIDAYVPRAVALLDRAFGDALTPEELQTLIALLGRVEASASCIGRSGASVATMTMVELPFARDGSGAAPANESKVKKSMGERSRMETDLSAFLSGRCDQTMVNFNGREIVDDQAQCVGL